MRSPSFASHTLSLRREVEGSVGRVGPLRRSSSRS